MDIGLRNVGETGAGIVIAFIDGAIEVAHPDLSPNHLAGRGKNYLDGSSDPSPRPGHRALQPKSARAVLTTHTVRPSQALLLHAKATPQADAASRLTRAFSE